MKRSKSNLFYTLLFCIPAFLLPAQNPCGPPGNVIVPAETPRKALDGEILKYYPNGKLMSKEYYRSDYRHGLQSYYYENGKLRRQSMFYFGTLSGTTTEYYENGNMKMEAYIVADKWHGPVTYYHENGRKKTEAFYNNGKPEGAYTYYYENGQAAYTIHYKEGNQTDNGDVLVYYPSGKLQRKEQYRSGKRIGNWIVYYENGSIKEEAVYAFAKMSGTLAEFKPNGDMSSLAHFVLDQNTQVRTMENNILLQGTKLYFDNDENPVKKEEYYRNTLLRTTNFPKAKNDFSWKLNFPDKTLHPRSPKDSLLPYPVAEGTFTDNTYYFNSITDRKGKVLLKNGNGNYFGPYCLVNDPAFLTDFIQTQEQCFFDNYYMNGFFHTDWLELNYIDVRSSFEGDRPVYLNDGLTMAKGKFKNGLKEGEWTEGTFFEVEYDEPSKGETASEFDLKPKRINLDAPESCYAQGKYVKGKKEGIWKLYNGDVVFEGLYVNGRRSGKWKTSERTVLQKKEGYRNYYNRAFVEGNYKNNLPDGAWKIFKEHSDTLQQERLYDEGWLLGETKDYYATHALKMSAVRSGDTLLRTRYTPLGDVIAVGKDQDDDYSYYEMTEGLKNGKYYSWDYNGHITKTGYYSNEKCNGTWLEFGYEGDTIARYHFVNGLLEGTYEKKEYGGSTKGEYVQGKKEGDWVEYNSGNKKESIYQHGKERIINYREGSSQLIKEGKGMISVKYDNPGSDPYDTKKKETYYENGVIAFYKEYYSTGKLKSLEYVTPRGDSLAVHNSPYGGMCVSSGNGVVTVYDSYNRIAEVDFYEAGKLQKSEYYNKGNYVSTRVFFASSYDKQALSVKRIFTKISDDTYRVQINVNGLMNAGTFQKATEKLPPGYIATSPPSVSSHAFFKPGEFRYVWTDNKESGFYFYYTLKIPKGAKLIQDYEGTFEYVKDNYKASVKIELVSGIY